VVERKKLVPPNNFTFVMSDLHIINFVNRGVHGDLLGTFACTYMEDKPDIEIYDIGLPGYVGLLYPDKARMVFHISAVQQHIRNTSIIKKRKTRRKIRVPIDI